jgi:Flp pilus assembly protein TadD
MNLNFLTKKTLSKFTNFKSLTHQEDKHSSFLSNTQAHNFTEKNTYKSVSQWSIYVGLFLAPLLFLPWTTSFLELNKQLLLIIVTGTGIVSWLLGVVSFGWLNWRKNPLDLGVLAFLGGTLLATIFSLVKFKSLFGLNVSLSNSLVTIVVLTIFYFLIANSFNDRGKVLVNILGLSVVLALIYGVLQLFGIHIFKASFAATNAFNSVGSVNALGVLSASLLPFFLRSKFNYKWFSRFHLGKLGIILSLIFLVMLNWWVIWTIAIVSMITMIVFDNMRGVGFRVKNLVFPMVIMVLGVFFIVTNFSFVGVNLPLEISPSFSLSKNIAFSVIKDHSAFGYGPENFSIAFDKFGASRLSNTTLSSIKFFDATTEFYNMMVHGGIVLMLAFAYLLWAFWGAIVRFKRYASRNNGSDSLSGDVGILSVSLTLFIAMFFYPFNFTLMFLVYVFLALTSLALWDKSMSSFNIEEKASLSLIASLGFIGGLILVLVGGYFSGTIYISDYKYAKALSANDSDSAISYLNEAIDLNNQDDRFFRTSSQITISLLSNELNNTTKTTPDKKATVIQSYISDSVTLARRATEISPDEALNWSNLGVVYQNLLAILDGADKLSEDAYLKASELRPGDANYFNSIGMLYLSKYELLKQLSVSANREEKDRLFTLAQDSVGKAESSLRHAIELSNNYGRAIYNLGAVYDRQGKVNDAILQLERIMPFNSNQPGLAFELGLLYYRAGRKDEALKQLQRAVLLSPTYSNARWYLALIYEEKGDLNSAIGQLQNILSIGVNKNNEVVINKLDELNRGQVSIPPGNVIDQKPLR